MLFAVKDYRGITVNLDEQIWQEKILDPDLGHPEVKAYLNQIKHTIARPDFVYQSIRDSRSRLFFKQLKQSDFAGYYLLTVVKYVQETESIAGYVSTAFVTKRLPKQSQLLWEKKTSST